jgi:Protein of unknown function (DUF3237)
MIEHLQSTFLFAARIGLSAPLAVGATPEGQRVIYHVTGGELSGPRIKGRYLPSGGEWARIRPDGSLAIDVRCCVETDDDALIYVTYQGRLVVPPELQGQVFDMAAPDRPAPSTYYFRVAPLFETASENYAWLNGIQAVGVGEVVQGGVAYRVYQID